MQDSFKKMQVSFNDEYADLIGDYNLDQYAITEDDLEDEIELDDEEID